MYSSINGGMRRMWDWNAVYSLTALDEVALKSEENSFLHNTGENEGGYTWISKKDCDRLAEIYGDEQQLMFIRADSVDKDLSWYFIFSKHQGEPYHDVWSDYTYNGVEGYRAHWRNTTGETFNKLVAPYFKWIPDSAVTASARRAKSKEITR